MTRLFLTRLLFFAVAFPGLSQTRVYTISTVAGSGGFHGDGGTATSAQLYLPNGIALDQSGNLYIADTGNDRVRKVTADGVIQTAAGRDEAGFGGDGSQAIMANLQSPLGVAVDGAGNLYIADSSAHRVRVVRTDGVIHTVAGNGTPGFQGDGGLATQASLFAPGGVAVDRDGNLYIADTGNHRIRKVTLDGVIQTVAGDAPGFAGDFGPAVAAKLLSPRGVAVDGQGNIYVSDTGNHRVRKISPDGVIRTLAGNGGTSFDGDGGPATLAQLNSPNGVAVDGGGNLYIADAGNQRVRKVTPDGVIQTVAGAGELIGADGDGGPAVSARLSPRGVAVDRDGSVYVADIFHNRVRKISPSGIITSVAGNSTLLSDGSAAASAVLTSPDTVAVDVAGNLYVADTGDNRIRKVSPDGVISTIAGGGEPGTEGRDKVPAISIQISSPRGLALDGSGNLYFVEQSRIRAVTTDGTIRTLIEDYSQIGGPGFAGFPRILAVDSAGSLYISSTGGSHVAKITPEGRLAVVAGLGGPGFDGDGGLATAARLSNPEGVAVDQFGNVYIADTGNQRVRQVSPDGIIRTVAGNGTPGSGGDGGPATAAQLYGPVGLAADAAGNLYIAEREGNRIRMVNTDGAIGTIAGTGESGFTGDGGPATLARMSAPLGLAVDSSGDVFVADSRNHRIRKLTPSNAGTNVPSFEASGVLNAASFLGGPVAPGEIVTIFGTAFGPGETAVLQLKADGRLETVLGGTRVLFDGVGAPLIYAAANQVSAIVPYGLAGKSSSQVRVEYQGVSSSPVTVQVASSSPGIFTASASGQGQAAALNQDFTLNLPDSPAAVGSIVTIYATGEGQTDPPGIDGSITTTVLPKPVLPVTVQVGGVSAEVLYAGGAPRLAAGLLQVNVRIPTDVAPGPAVPVLLTVGQATSPDGVTIAIGPASPDT